MPSAHAGIVLLHVLAPKCSTSQRVSPMWWMPYIAAARMSRRLHGPRPCTRLSMSSQLSACSFEQVMNTRPSPLMNPVRRCEAFRLQA